MARIEMRRAASATNTQSVVTFALYSASSRPSEAGAVISVVGASAAAQQTYLSYIESYITRGTLS